MWLEWGRLGATREFNFEEKQLLKKSTWKTEKDVEHKLKIDLMELRVY
jgi:hypothetical protein